jgi:hypothetical protein
VGRPQTDASLVCVGPGRRLPPYLGGASSEASWKALVDAIRLELMRLTEKDGGGGAAVEG